MEDKSVKFHHESRRGRGWQHPLVMRTAIFILLFGFWMLLSGKFVVEFLVLGAVASALVVFLTSHLLEPTSTEDYKPLPQSFLWLGLTIVRFFFYMPWLIVEIATANFQVAYQILHPKMPISPRLVVFDATLESEPAQILLAQSITLTPGTITVDLDRGKFVVHALFAAHDQILERGGMQDRVSRVFGEPSKPTSSARIISDINELQA